MTREQAREFASRWLPAWTGNDPEKLAAFYSNDAVYLDPTIPQGVKGKEALLKYFRKLLSRNPDWVWTQIEPIPMEDGFLNKWLARIPVGDKVVECIGVCFVQFDGQGLIRRNEVYFDCTKLNAAINALIGLGVVALLFPKQPALSRNAGAGDLGSAPDEEWFVRTIKGKIVHHPENAWASHRHSGGIAEVNPFHSRYPFGG